MSKLNSRDRSTLYLMLGFIAGVVAGAAVAFVASRYGHFIQDYVNGPPVC